LRILISNDDGVTAPGIEILAETIAQSAEVTVVAPDKNRSASSAALTLDRPLRYNQLSNGYYSVTGTPCDCVHLGSHKIMSERPDMVIAGINRGPNLGDDVIYSGTVAAAMEGRNLGLPAIAVSIASFQPQHFSTAVEAIVVLLRQLSYFRKNSATILNINIPDIPWNEIKGFQVTRLGKRHTAEAVIKSKDPRGHSIYWVGPPGKKQDAGEGTDFYAVDQGYISVTPLQIDLTHYQAINSTATWLESIKESL